MEPVLPRNQWYYHYEKKSSVIGQPPPNPARAGREFKFKFDDVISFASLLAMLAAIDFVWFVHRMARTYSTAKMILYGRVPPQGAPVQDGYEGSGRGSDFGRSTSAGTFLFVF